MKYHALYSITLTWLNISFSLATYGQGTTPPQKAAGSIITDDVMMLGSAAAGVEPLACCPFAKSKVYQIEAGKNARIDWGLAKSLNGDSLRVMLVEIQRAGEVISRFTLVMRPKEAMKTLQCMKGFGCAGTWEAFPWKAPKGNYLDHTGLKFRLRPGNTKFFTLENYDEKLPLTVRINPCGAEK